MKNLRVVSIALLGVVVTAMGHGQTNVTTSGGSSGTVPVYTGSATLGNSPITVSGSNVGIGTTPSTALTVAGDVTVTPVGGLSLVITNRTGTTFASSPVVVATNGTLFVGPANNPPVGLGVDNLGTPAVFVGQTELNNGKLQVGGASALGGLILQSGNGANTQGLLIIRNGVGSESMRVTTSGDVGIATTGPQYTLDVSGSVHASGPVYYQDRLYQISAWTGVQS